ncbi:hypothetical protein SLA2020_506380 [Shorea laevis]
MAYGTAEALHDRINRKLRDPALINSSSHMIFKVPYPLREINEKAYEPLVISIGPYHHGKKHLKAMEVQKMKSLKSILDHTGENIVEKYVTTLKEMEEKIRGFYSENLNIEGEKLVEMMLLDGFFIIELIYLGKNSLANINRSNVLRDLLLVENQLPLSVLSQLHSMSMDQRGLPRRDSGDNIVKGVILWFDRIVLGLPTIARAENLDANNMLGLLHDSITRTSRRPPSSATASSWWRRCLTWASRLPFPRWLPCLAPAQVLAGMSEPRKWRFIRSATELKETGIKFQKKEGHLFDIEFQKGVMSIPTLIVDDETESILRNFVAYEQCNVGIFSTPFTDYTRFMDCLINTEKDVGLLCRCGVLDNWLGDNEVVATMFNRLGDSVLISKENFHYSVIFIRVNEHCNRKWNQWKANLRHNYFNNPWASTSVIAAFILLSLTALQSVYSVLAYYHQH